MTNQGGPRSSYKGDEEDPFVRNGDDPTVEASGLDVQVGQLQREGEQHQALHAGSEGLGMGDERARPFLLTLPRTSGS